jgi:hypothetical protein
MPEWAVALKGQARAVGRMGDQVPACVHALSCSLGACREVQVVISGASERSKLHGSFHSGQEVNQYATP